MSEATRPPSALGAAVVIRDGRDRVLLVHHTYGRLNWEIPGGGCDPGESAADTARREAHEELGVDVTLGPLVRVYWERKLGRGVHHFVFTAELLGPLPAVPPDPKEISEWEWFPRSALPRPISDFTVQRIDDAFDGAHPTVVAIGERQWLE